ncbi:DUF397 domain-containing protein [Actinomadura sp. DSM 109109]|nr:DUF397 domain-containing protein [Actinomadura lepetitiana]
MYASNSSRSVWRKSTHSGGNGECIEVARLAGAIGVRDSKDPAGVHLSVAPGAFGALISSIKQEDGPTR